MDTTTQQLQQNNSKTRGGSNKLTLVQYTSSNCGGSSSNHSRPLRENESTDNTSSGNDFQVNPPAYPQRQQHPSRENQQYYSSSRDYQKQEEGQSRGCSIDKAVNSQRPVQHPNSHITSQKKGAAFQQRKQSFSGRSDSGEMTPPVLNNSLQNFS